MNTAISRKVVAKKVHATIPKGNMGYDHYTVPNDCSCRTCFFLLSFSTRKHMSMASPAILSNFFVEEWTQNHPQYLSGLSRALFPTTFLEIAVYGHVLKYTQLSLFWGHAFWKQSIWRQSKIIRIKRFKLLSKDNKGWFVLNRSSDVGMTLASKIHGEVEFMSLTSLPLPPRKVHLWHIFWPYPRWMVPYLLS